MKILNTTLVIIALAAAVGIAYGLTKPPPRSIVITEEQLLSTNFFLIPVAGSNEHGLRYVDDANVMWMPIITEYGLKRKRVN